jgi:hypothetical protein
LSVENPLTADPVAYARDWGEEVAKQIGKAKEVCMKLKGLDCQDTLITRLQVSAAAMEKAFDDLQLVKPMTAEALTEFMVLKGKPVMETYTKFEKIASGTYGIKLIDRVQHV